METDNVLSHQTLGVVLSGQVWPIIHLGASYCASCGASYDGGDGDGGGDDRDDHRHDDHGDGHGDGAHRIELGIVPIITYLKV